MPFGNQNGVGIGPSSINFGAEPSVVSDGRTTEYGESARTCGFGATGAGGVTGIGGATGTTVPGAIVVEPQPVVVLPHPPWQPLEWPPHRLPLLKQENSLHPEVCPHPPLQPAVV